jgi:KDEL-tailed cysteine endopeptidase
MRAALDQQPLSVLVDDGDIFGYYKGGIIDTEDCGTDVNHAVVAVGFGNADGKDYWLVRNSWGTGWGEGGYVRIAAVDGPGICGIN